MKTTQYVRQEKAIAVADSGGIRQRWIWGLRLLRDAEAMSSPKSLKNGVVDQLVAAAKSAGLKLSEREIRYRLQCARAYPTEAQFRHVESEFEDWSALRAEGFPAREVPESGVPAEQFEPDATSPLAAGSTSFDTSWYAAQEGLIQAATVNDRAKRVGPSLGYLYVIEFASGVVKVGKAVNPRRRIATHATHARVHGGEVRHSWVSERHAGFDVTERVLIEGCKQVGELAFGNEYFRSVDFGWANQYAGMVVLGRKRRAYLDSLIEAADYDLSVAWQEAHDRLALDESPPTT